MSFRNDLDAANARIDTLERERRELVEHNARLTARLRKPDVDTEPKPWPLAPAWLTSIVDAISALFSRR